MGDYRDGDELWYQYRTQPFCANVAYSLFGVTKKKDKNGESKRTRSPPMWMDTFDTGCRRGRRRAEENENAQDDAVDDAYYNANDDENNDDDGYASNSMCVDVDGTGLSHYSYNNGEEGGGSQDEYSYTSTMGCSATDSGRFTIARFESYVCDGTDFVDDLDELEDYNAQHDAIGCTRLWDASWEEDGSSSTSVPYANATANLIALLQSSWACNLEMYPDECPDPYGLKAKHEHALLTASRGGNGQMSLKTQKAQHPFRVMSLCLAILASILFVFGYCMKHYVRARETNKRYLIFGYAVCAWADFCEKANNLWLSLRARDKTGIDRSGLKRGGKKTRKSRKSKHTDNREHDRKTALLAAEDSDPEKIQQLQRVAPAEREKDVASTTEIEDKPTFDSVPIDEREIDLVIDAAKTPVEHDGHEESDRSEYYSSHSRD
ncbi:MAG: hypothetical protein SGILL_001374 [Bacillariaceae sp.]